MGYYAQGIGTLLRPAATLGAPLAAVAISPVLPLALFAGLHWVTLRNRRRVELDRKGRIVRGLPAEFEGVDVRDVSALSHEMRSLQSAEAECAASVMTRRPRTFPSAAGAAKELIAANPPLAQLLESDCSHDCVRYRQWLQRDRRGPKPQAGPGDGRFDALNERLELHGRRRVGSWLEAVHVTVPPSRRWEDFAPRLEVLEEATGLRLNLPDAAEAFAGDAAAAAACAERADDAAGELLNAARAGRLAAAPRSSRSAEVPF